MLWIFLTLAAAPLQVARNALQRSLLGDAGPLGAVLVRFLFGLPFSLAILGIALLLTPDAKPEFTTRFWVAISLGAASQLCASAALLLAMRRSGFAVATAMQQSSLPIAAILGSVFLGDALSPLAWAGVIAAAAGVTILSWPGRDQAQGGAMGALLGLGSGVAFAVTLNAYRQSGLALEPVHPVFAGVAGVCVAQALQSITLSAFLGLTRPAALRAVAASWRQSLGAGVFGAAASALWFAALALAPAAAVRAVGVAEIPVAALAGSRLFRERLDLRRIMGAALTAAGVVATAFGSG